MLLRNPNHRLSFLEWMAPMLFPFKEVIFFIIVFKNEK